MKKLIGIFTALVMMLSSLNIAVFAASDTTQTSTSAVSDRYIELFSSLGIFPKTYSKTDSITRAQYAQMLTRLLGYEDRLSSMRGVAYSDVAVDYTLSREINLMNVLGIMTAKEGDKFCPEEKLTMDDAVMYMVRALGYTIIAEKSGGAPDGYNKIADSLGIRKGISSELMTPYAAAGAIARLFYNSLDVEILSYEEGQTIFKDYLELERGTGRVSAVYGLSIVSGTDLDTGEIMIGDRTFKTSLSSLMSYFGCMVEYYFREDDAAGETALVYVRPLKKSDEVTISGADIEDFEDNRLRYTEEGKTTYQTLKISEDAIVIYNGNTVAKMESEYIPANGYIKCISTEGGEPYDIVIIFNYQSFVVESVFNGTVSFRYGNKFESTDGNSYTAVSLSSDNSIVEKNGSYVLPDTISSGDVVSIAYSGKTYYVTISDKKIKSVVRSVTYDPTECYINGEYYRVDEKFEEFAKSGTDGLKEIASGLNATFYLDASNRIVGMDFSASEMRYGYLRYVDELENMAVIYDNAEKEFVTYTVDKKCLLNGSRAASVESLFEQLQDFIDDCKAKTRYDENNALTAFDPPIIKFKTNNDRNLTSITTQRYNLAAVNADPAEGEISRTAPLSDNYITISPYSSKIWQTTDKIFTSYLSDLGTLRVKGGEIMKIPENGDADEFESSDSAQNLLPHTDNKGVKVIIYDVDFETSVPGFIVYVQDSGSAKVEIDTSLYGVKSVGTAANADGDVCASVELYSPTTGLSETYITADDAETIAACRSLQKGDVVQISTNYKGYITGIAKLVSYNRPEDFDVTIFTNKNSEQGKRMREGYMMFFGDFIKSKYVTQGNLGSMTKISAYDPYMGTNAVLQFNVKGLVYDGHDFYSKTIDCASKGDRVFGVVYVGAATSFVVFKYDQPQYTSADDFFGYNIN